MSGRKSLYTCNMEGILRIEKLNAKNIFELNLGCYQINTKVSSVSKSQNIKHFWRGKKIRNKTWPS